MKSWLKKAILSMGVALFGANAAAAADAFPTRPVRIIVNTAPGGFVDIMSRLAAQHMAEHFKQPVVVENRPGGDGMIAIRAVKAAAPDGYTLLAAAGTAAQQMALRQDPGYDLVKDFTGIGIICRSPFLMVVGQGSPDKTMADFVARAKANPGKLSYASAGVGTVPHFATERFLRQLGLKVAHVPYKGNAPALPDVMTGRVDMIFDTYASGYALVRAGKFRALGVTSAKRLTVLPDVPTLAEQGVPDYSYYTWVGFFAPAGTPKDVVQRLSDAQAVAKATAAVKERFRNDGLEAVDMSPEQFNQFLASEVARNQKFVADLGLEKH